MSRVRTGHGPQDWSAPDDGVPARVVGANFGGELVVAYTPAPVSRDRQSKADLSAYRPPWIGVQKCGSWMPRASARCGRLLGHRRECRTTFTLEERKQRIRKTVAA